MELYFDERARNEQRLLAGSATPNDRFILEWLRERPEGPILDYGCGKGRMLSRMLVDGLDGYGVELVGPGAGTNIVETHQRLGLAGTRARTMGLDCNIPFPDKMFNTVVSNQVFEHVEDLDAVLTEISRILMPGGVCLFLFPTLGTIMEGHCKLPFAHHMPEGKLRYLYLLVLRLAGFGRFPKTGPFGIGGPDIPRNNPFFWARYFNEWLTNHVTYRTDEEVDELLGKHIGTPEGLETEYLQFRLEDRYRKLPPLSGHPILKRAASEFTKRWGGRVLTVTKRNGP